MSIQQALQDVSPDFRPLQTHSGKLTIGFGLEFVYTVAKLLNTIKCLGLAIDLQGGRPHLEVEDRVLHFLRFMCVGHCFYPNYDC